MDNDKLNQSTKAETRSSTSKPTKMGPVVKWITEDPTVACNLCEIADTNIKIRCGQCRRLWHQKCGKGSIQESRLIKVGKWQCKQCIHPSTPDQPSTSDNHDITRVEVGGCANSTHLPTSQTNPSIAIGQNITKIPHQQQTTKPNNKAEEQPLTITEDNGTQSTHVKTLLARHNPPPALNTNVQCEEEPPNGSENEESISVTSSRQQLELLQLLDEELEVEKKQLRIKAERQLLESQVQLQLQEAIAAAELETIRRKRQLIESGSSKSSVSSRSRQKNATTLAPPQRRVELVDTWLQSNPEPSTSRHHRETNQLQGAIPKRIPTSRSHPTHYTPRGLSFLNPNVTVNDFVEDTLGNSDDEEINLTSKQLRARQVLNRELPDFDGDPTDWPSFIARFSESTKRCGYTEVENLDRLARSLKGKAYRAVKSELHKRDALPSVLGTLKMLYGRPEAVYTALVRNIKEGPQIKEDSLEGLVTFAMSVKTLCDTLNTTDLQEYLFNPILVMDLVEKLPIHYRIMWGNYGADLEERGTTVNLQTFNNWVRRQAEIFAATNKQTTSATTTRFKPAEKTRKQTAYQMSHSSTISTPHWTGYCHSCKSKGHMTFNCPELLKLSIKERWEQIRKQKLCLKCLGRHQLRQCGSATTCGVTGCIKPHHPILHEEPEQSRSAQLSQTHEIREMSDDESQNDGNTHTKNVSIHASYEKYMFQIVPVVLSNGGYDEIQTFAFLDSGSEVTLITNQLAESLHLKGPLDQLKMKWSNEQIRVEKESRRVQPTISDVKRMESFTLKNVRTVKTLTLPTQSINGKGLQQYTHLKPLPLLEYSNAKPEILIGMDNYQLLVPQETVEGNWDEPVAIRTRLGWTLYGNTKEADVTTEATINNHAVSNEELRDLVERYFSLDNIGITSPVKEVESINDSRARELMEKVVSRRPDGRYETSLLWKDVNVMLPDSFAMAFSRFKQFERKVERDGIREKVNNIINEYYTCGFIVPLTKTEESHRTNKTWYLPIFTVENPNKPGKIRLVWDAAATVNGKSLNDHLYIGPDMLCNLNAILYKFREKRVAVGGDIERMFHQINIKQEDQDAQRFLWRNSKSEAITTYKMKVMTFGAACSPSLSQYVKNQNADRFVNVYPRATEAIRERHYVDDYLDSFDTENEAIEVLEQVRRIHTSAGFNLRSIVSNSKSVMQTVEREVRGAVDKRAIIEPEDNSVKVLGMWWDMISDTLRFQLNFQRVGMSIIDGSEVPTKRQVLKTLMMLFDPLGLIGYLSLKGKLVLKSIWRRQSNWDEQIHEDEMKRWLIWLRDLKEVENITIKRCYFKAPNIKYELHVFTDAGEEANAAVAYIVAKYDNLRQVAMIGSKTKVGPNRPISIPRMELQAALIGARLGTTIKLQHSLQFERCAFWTDSRNVLCWIRSPRRFKVYVAHRIGEIREATHTREWRYVPTDENPADLGTKWLTITQEGREMWENGPTFLQQEEKFWPEEPTNLPPIEEEVLELRCNLHETEPNRSLCPDFEHFSSFNRLLRTQAYVLRFFHWGKKLIECKSKVPTYPLKRNEIEEAEQYIIREIQANEFGEDIKRLKAEGILEKTSKLREYNPFIDANGLIRSRSRLQEAEYLTPDQRFPIVLPRKHHVTQLIIRHTHERYQHMNHSIVLNELKQRYVIPAVRATLKSLRRNCWECKRRSATPTPPEMSPLPRSRLAIRMRPFSYTGMDYFGPLHIRHGRRVEKRWGVIFTCLTTRAVHLEIASSLSTDNFLLVLRRFIARRGSPNDVYCDNGTNFKGAEAELKRTAVENSKNAEQYQHINWHFNPPHAPHMGGAWERLVRAIKESMRCLISERLPTDDLLNTVMVEIEMIVNTRPLTYVDTEAGSLEALTPNHFILGSSGGTKPIGNFTDDPEVLRKEWKRQQLVVTKFWRRFVAEYLPEISKRTKWHDRVEPLAVGDVVAIADSNLPGSWRLGRIISVVSSKDGGVRQAVVKTMSGEVRRPASKLAVLVRDKLRDEGVSSAGGGVENSLKTHEEGNVSNKQK